MAEHAILIVEDDSTVRELLKYRLNKKYDVATAANGEEALERIEEKTPHLIISDIMMPKMDGFTLAREVRKMNSSIPFIFLTAKSMQDDVLEGFSIGADDYITKPFSMEELLYRIKAILKRASPDEESEKNRDQYDIGKYKFDANKQILTIDGRSRKLTTKEAELLKLLCNNKNQMLDRNYALRTIWEDDSYFNARSMDVYITKLRKYLKEDSSIQILNVHGKGYKLIA